MYIRHRATRVSSILTFAVGVALICDYSVSEERLEIAIEGTHVLSYQAAPLSNPRGGDRFRGSNFIHPLKTPSGFVITQSQPGDHMHHFGLWLPWKYVERDGRRVLFWELQRGPGIVEAQESAATENGFSARSFFIDRGGDEEDNIWIEETLAARVSGIVESPATGYFLDLNISHEGFGEEDLTIVQYRYSGFCLRGTEAWNRHNSTVVTSMGEDYSSSNFTHARWVLIQGEATEDETAGVLMMSHPENYNHPERLRTWDPETHNGAIFVNFNPVQSSSRILPSGETDRRRYRLFIFDGSISTDQAEQLWRQYAD